MTVANVLYQKEDETDEREKQRTHKQNVHDRNEK